MIKEFSRFGDSITLAALAFAAVAGVFLGLFSCGGEAWRYQAFMGGALLLTLTATLLPGRLLRQKWRRAAFPVLALLVFIFSQSITAPFYPSAPKSVSEYWGNVLRVLEAGPC